jgi:hypothetical protein
MRTSIFTAAALLFATLMASSGPALARAKADAATGAPTSVGASAAAQDEKKVCRQLPNSASRMTKRACLTRAQWKQVEKEK